MNRVGALLQEAVAGTRSQFVASVLTAAMVAGMCVAVLLTTGRTVAAERAVLDEIDAAGTRSVVVRASEGEVTAGMLDQLRNVTGIESVTGFGPIVDARNAGVPGGPKAPLRRGYGTIGDRRLLAMRNAGEMALASAAGTSTLGLWDGTGGVVTDDGSEVVVAGGLLVPDHLKFLEPLVVIPSSGPDTLAGARPDEPLAVLVVLARSPSEVAAVEALVRSLLDPADTEAVTVETSAELVAIRAAVGRELGSQGRTTVLGILAIAAVMVTANLLALVTMRRKDFGRRRALGATRSLIIGLMVVQVSLLATAGSIVGSVATLASLAAAGSPLPAPEFTLAVAIAAVLTSVLAALPPAAVAARRDPLHELRIP